MKQNITFSIFLFMCSIAFFSCSRRKPAQTPAAVQKQPHILIGFSIDTFIIERWQRDVDIFIDTAENLGAEVIVQTSGNSVAVQNSQIKYLLDKGVDVLVIVPKEASTLTETLRLAHQRNIPVISYDRLIKDSDISLYITIDSQKVGEFMAQKLADLRPRGKYLCMYGPKEDNNMLMATTGVNRVLAKYPDIKIIKEYYVDNWNFDLAYQKMNEFLDTGLRPDAVICGNDAVAESVIRSLGENGLEGVLVSGQDADIAACQRIVTGKQTMTVYKPITVLAKKAAKYACAFAGNRNFVPEGGDDETLTTMNNGYRDVPTILLKPVSVTKKNIDTVIIASGFHTHDEVYEPD